MSFYSLLCLAHSRLRVLLCWNPWVKEGDSLLRFILIYSFWNLWCSPRNEPTIPTKLMKLRSELNPFAKPRLNHTLPGPFGGTSAFLSHVHSSENKPMKIDSHDPIPRATHRLEDRPRGSYEINLVFCGCDTPLQLLSTSHPFSARSTDNHKNMRRDEHILR